MCPRTIDEIRDMSLEEKLESKSVHEEVQALMQPILNSRLLNVPPNDEAVLSYKLDIEEHGQFSGRNGWLWNRREMLSKKLVTDSELHEMINQTIDGLSSPEYLAIYSYISENELFVADYIFLAFEVASGALEFMHQGDKGIDVPSVKELCNLFYHPQENHADKLAKIARLSGIYDWCLNFDYGDDMEGLKPTFRTIDWKVWDDK